MIKSLKPIKLKSFLVAGGLVGAMSAYCAPAYAQIDEIVVSARKVEENLQDVPISVTAITGSALLNAGITEFPEIAQITPNFDIRSDEVRGDFAAVVNIRGQNSTTSDLTIDQAVGINVNGAPITRGTNLFGNLFDIEQVEVLRGPQGTLFGKNTTGGTVIVTTHAPVLEEFSGYGEVTVGNFDQIDIEGVVNVPIGETAALRFGGALTDRDGFGDGVRSDGTLSGLDLGDDNEAFLRGSLLVEPNDRLSVRINADYHDVDENGAIIRALIDAFPIASPVDASEDFFLGADFDDAFFAPITIPNGVEADEFNINGTVKADLGFAELTSVTSFRDQESETSLNFSPLGGIVIGQDSELFAQELRLAGDYNDKLKWQVGAFYSDETGSDRNNTIGRNQITDVENEAISVFAQGTYALTDRLNVTLGGRYTDEDRSVELIQLGALAGTPVPGAMPDPNDPDAPLPTIGIINVADAAAILGTTTLDDGSVIINNAAGTTIINDASFDGFSFTAALDYKFTDDVLGYASISRGFRSGGIDGDGDLATEVDPEFVLNYEAGFKADFFENTVRFNAAAWFSDYSDIQIQSFALDETVAGAVGVPVAVLNNAAEAELYGFEAELVWFPIEDLSISVGVGFTEGEFQDFIEPRLNVLVPDDPDTLDINEEVTEIIQFDRSDEPVGGPNWQFNYTPRYSFDVTENIRGHGQFTVSFLDDQELAGPEVINLPVVGEDLAEVGSITLVNGQIDFDIGEDLNVAFWGTNILDNEHASTGFAIGVAGGLAQRTIGAPRQYGIRLKKSF